MSRQIIASLICLSLSLTLMAGDRRTLRVDCIFSGTDKTQSISLYEYSDAGEWAGRQVNMDKLLLKGNGQISLSDKASGRLLYINSFSTLFQEWQNTEEAKRRNKAFENVFLLPMPEEEAIVTIELFDHKGRRSAIESFEIDPADILIRKSEKAAADHRYLLKNGSSNEKIDLVIVAEGYTEAESELFYKDAEMAMNSIFSHQPFTQMKDRFNVVAVALESRESGVSVPHEGNWKDTALSSSFDTFYSERYLTTLKLFQMHDALAGIPYESIIILANTQSYGGGGIFNSYMLSAAHNQWAAPVIAHEFGHSFAGLADEYYYDDQFVEYYYPEVEPWEPNITTLKDFSSKWEDMTKDKSTGASLIEGGGYQSKGVYRAYESCRMKVNDFPSFCPVCEAAIRKIIDYYTL